MIIGFLATLLQYPSVKNVNEAPAPLLPSNRTDQRLQHQALYASRLAYETCIYEKSTNATQRDTETGPIWGSRLAPVQKITVSHNLGF